MKTSVCPRYGSHTYNRMSAAAEAKLYTIRRGFCCRSAAQHLLVKLHLSYHSSPSPPPTSPTGRANSANSRAKRASRGRQASLYNLDNLTSASGAISSFSSESEGIIPVKRRRGSRSHSRASRGSLCQLKTSPSSTATVSTPDPSGENAEEQSSSSSVKIASNSLPTVKQSASPNRNKERLYLSSPPLPPQPPTYIHNNTHNDPLTRGLDSFYNSRRLAESILLYLPLILAIYRFRARDDLLMTARAFWIVLQYGILFHLIGSPNIELATIGGVSAAVSVLLRALSSSPARTAELNDVSLNPGKNPKEPGRAGDREGRRPSVTFETQAGSSNWVFMTDSRNYRCGRFLFMMSPLY